MQFTRKDTPTIQDGLVVRYQLEPDSPGGGEISASRNGVCISGYFPTMSEEMVQEFLDTLYKALVQHRSIRNTSTALSERTSSLVHVQQSEENALDHPLLQA